MVLRGQTCAVEPRARIIAYTLNVPPWLRAVRASGLNLTFESLKGFPPVSHHASLTDANRNFHHSQAR